MYQYFPVFRLDKADYVIDAFMDFMLVVNTFW